MLHLCWMSKWRTVFTDLPQIFAFFLCSRQRKPDVMHGFRMGVGALDNYFFNYSPRKTHICIADLISNRSVEQFCFMSLQALWLHAFFLWAAPGGKPNPQSFRTAPSFLCQWSIDPLHITQPALSAIVKFSVSGGHIIPKSCQSCWESVQRNNEDVITRAGYPLSLLYLLGSTSLWSGWTSWGEGGWKQLLTGAQFYSAGRDLT